MTAIGTILAAIEAVRAAIRSGNPLALWDALSPLLLEFGTSAIIIDEAGQRILTRRVHETLRSAGLLEGVDLP